MRMHRLEKLVWLASLPLGIAACFFPFTNFIVSIKFLALAFAIRGTTQIGGFLIGRLSFKDYPHDLEKDGHPYRLETDRHPHGLEWIVAAATLFGLTLIVSSAGTASRGDEDRDFRKVTQNRIEHLETWINEHEKNQIGGVVGSPPGQQQTALRPAFLLPLIVVALGLAAFFGGLFWFRHATRKGKIAAVVMTLGGALSITKGAITIVDKWEIKIPITITKPKDNDKGSKPPDMPPKIQERPSAPNANPDLRACSIKSVGPFDSCSADVKNLDQIRFIGKQYLEGLQKWNSGLIILVGSADNQRLSSSCSKRFGTNAELAHQRGIAVAGELQKFLSDAGGRANSTVLVSGPRLIQASDHDRHKDRTVEAWVVWNWNGQGPQPTCAETGSPIP
jgi:hypothetical protein